eukprot:TRINITY_DN1178_c0_g1_i2.p1 TRINITY_DN1178_c0_g1~~TRINITY_DN1178_c0_g1_i2.p1  ORF type:complete len:471 (+),score=159.70 TRINITY_DN1178_c0_g1_i2:140-1552(+)
MASFTKKKKTPQGTVMSSNNKGGGKTKVIQFEDSEENDDDDFIDASKPPTIRSTKSSTVNTFKSLATRKTSTAADGIGETKTKKARSGMKKATTKKKATKARVTRTSTTTTTTTTTSMTTEVMTTKEIKQQADIRSFFSVDEQHEANIERKKRKEKEKQMWPEPGCLPKTNIENAADQPNHNADPVSIEAITSIDSPEASDMQSTEVLSTTTVKTKGNTKQTSTRNQDIEEWKRRQKVFVKNLSPTEQEERKKVREELLAQERRRQKEREIEQQKKVVQAKQDEVDRITLELEDIERTYNEATKQLNQLRFKQFDQIEQERYSTNEVSKRNNKQIASTTNRNNQSNQPQSFRLEFASRNFNSSSSSSKRATSNIDAPLMSKRSKSDSVHKPTSESSTRTKLSMIDNTFFDDNDEDDDELEEPEDEMEQRRFEQFEEDDDFDELEEEEEDNIEGVNMRMAIFPKQRRKEKA